MRNPERRRCEAVTRTGRPCGNWALRREGEGATALCGVHGGRARCRMPGAGDEAAGRRCTATTVVGDRCRNWALEYMHPPRCRVHAYPDAHARLRHGYYRHHSMLPPGVQATIAQMAEDGEPLGAEIVIARLKIASLLAYLEQPDLPPADWLAATRILLLALRTTGRLMRAQHALIQTKEKHRDG